jgi:hypothetical protein
MIVRDLFIRTLMYSCEGVNLMLARKRALLVRAANLLAEKRANDAMAAIVRVVLKLPTPARCADKS